MGLGNSIRFRVEMAEVERAFRQLGKVPQAVAWKSAKAGMDVAYKDVKANAPQGKTKLLKRSLFIRKEKRSKLGKGTYFISFKKANNGDGFNGLVKLYGKPRLDKRAYYPASLEWGWTRGKGTPHQHKFPGRYYLKKAIDNNKAEIQKKTLETAGKEIDKLLGR